eukprot:GHVR01035107.1.p1 GENE.GHVR01035107.1~~GHVR01035107.1.p1  ORF type:complete len:157 (-),score=46.80 GHVR01035107.1:524-994(-)
MDLVECASRVTQIHNLFSHITTNNNHLNNMFNRMRSEVQTPYLSMRENVTVLRNISKANEAIRDCSRFMFLVRKLAAQLKALPELNKTNADTHTHTELPIHSTLSEIDSLLFVDGNRSPLSRLSCLQPQVDFAIKVGREINTHTHKHIHSRSSPDG